MADELKFKLITCTRVVFNDTQKVGYCQGHDICQNKECTFQDVSGMQNIQSGTYA